MLYLLIAILLVIIGIYLVVLYGQHNAKRELNKRNEEVKHVVENNLDDQFKKITQLQLSGESYHEFEKLEKNYRYLFNRQLPEISEQLNETAAKLEKHKSLGVRKDFDKVDSRLDNVQETYEHIEHSLQAILENTQEQQQATKDLSLQYQEIQKTLLAKSFSFGPAISALEEKLKQLEEDFDDYVALTSSGDYAKAVQPMNALKARTAELEEALEYIPFIYKNLKTVYPQQIDELKNAVSQLKMDNYGFKRDLPAELFDIEQDTQTLLEQITTLQVREARKLDPKVADDIEKVYAEIEREYLGRQLVESNEKQMAVLIHKVQQDENQLIQELERLQQNYELNHHQLEDAKALEKEIARIKANFEIYHHRGQSEVFVYSILNEDQQEALAMLKNISNEQSRIKDSVAHLWKEEQDAQQAVQHFDMEIHQLQREIETLNLPGLPNDYLDYFDQVDAEIKQLDYDLNQVRVDMDQITHGLMAVQTDLDILTVKTREIVDCSILTEELMQYSNRYRIRHPEMAHAYQEAMKLFDKQYDYVGALTVISEALDKVEPGAYDKIATKYKEGQNQNNPLT